VQCRTGDSEHTPNPTWTPLLPTPNNPSFPGSQSCIAGAAQVIFETQYGTDNFTFVVGTEGRSNGALLPNRVFRSFSLPLNRWQNPGWPVSFAGLLSY